MESTFLPRILFGYKGNIADNTSIKVWWQFNISYFCLTCLENVCFYNGNVCDMMESYMNLEMKTHEYYFCDIYYRLICYNIKRYPVGFNIKLGTLVFLSVFFHFACTFHTMHIFYLTYLCIQPAMLWFISIEERITQNLLSHKTLY